MNSTLAAILLAAICFLAGYYRTELSRTQQEPAGVTGVTQVVCGPDCITFRDAEGKERASFRFRDGTYASTRLRMELGGRWATIEVDDGRSYLELNGRSSRNEDAAYVRIGAQYYSKNEIDNAPILLSSGVAKIHVAPAHKFGSELFMGSIGLICTEKYDRLRSTVHEKIELESRRGKDPEVILERSGRKRVIAIE